MKVQMIKESLIDYRFKVSCNDGPEKIIKTVAENEDKAIKYVKDMYSQEHTTYADDRENKWDIKNLDTITEALKPRDSSEKLITLLVRDPDKQLENLLEYIKVNAHSGHSFPVEVDPHDSEKKESFYIDGDGSCHILDMEIIQGDDVEEEL